MYNVENVIQTLQTYVGEAVYLILFSCSLLYICLKVEKENKKRIFIIIGFGILFVFNDFSRNILERFSGGTYYRFLWMVPFIMVIAYVTVRVMSEQKKACGRILIVFAVLIMVFQGSNFFIGSTLRLPENKYNILNDVIQVSDIITEHKKIERPVAIFDLELQLPIRTYDASIIWGISRGTYMNYEKYEDYEQAGNWRDEIILIRAVNCGIKEETDVLAEALEAKNVDYIVTKTSFGMDEYFAEVGYGLIGRSDSRSVYGKK